MTEKTPCPTCGRTVTVQADATVRRHKPADVALAGPDGWCPGGVVPRPGEAKVLQMKKPGGPRKAAHLTPAQKAAENARRSDSKALDKAGHGSCGAKKSGSEDRCTNPRGGGTDHLGFGRCKNHGGASENGKKHAALERARAEAEKVRRAQLFYGRRVAVDPEQALLEEMQRSVGVVRWLEQAIHEWGEFERFAAELAETDPAPDNDEGKTAAEKLLDGLMERGQRILDGHAVTESVTYRDPGTGLPSLVAIHSTEHAVGFTDTEYRAWLKVYAEERRHLAQVAKACLDANIAERRQQVLEARGEMIRSLVLIAFKLAGVELDKPRALEIIAQATKTVAKELPA